MCRKDLDFPSKSAFLMGLLGLIVLAAGATSPERPALASGSAGTSPEAVCKPTTPDSLGPFYKPDAPVRSSVGKGYVLQGVVRSAKDCSPVAGAKIECWLAGPNGQYDDEHRATLFSDASGVYRFESNLPPPYGFRPPHIHLRVSTTGHKTLITQHYPVGGQTEASFDLVLTAR